MLLNYLKTSFRDLIRNKTYSVINILGLSIALASSVLILLYLKNELTYDSFHIQKKNIYRVGFKTTMPTTSETSAITTAGVAPSLLNEFPEVENAVRIRSPKEGYFTFRDINYEARNVCFADSSFFQVFSFKLISGSISAVLSEPYSIVLTSKLAKKIFGKEDPIGKIIKWNNEYSLVVRGVAEDCPENSSIRFSSLISFSTLYNQPDIYLDWNGGHDYYTYIKLSPKASLESISTKLPDFLEKHINYIYKKSGWSLDLIFNRLDRMHLHSKLDYDPTAEDPKKLLTVALTGFFVLLIAGFNFINLSTARSTKRGVEIGIRKVLGAHRQQVAIQFLGEAVLYALISFITALILVEIFQPMFTLYIGSYELYQKSNTTFFVLLIVFTILVGLLAGLYPSFFIAKFNPIKTLKGLFTTSGGKEFLRNTLVILQFVISTVIITYTMVMLMQNHYMQNKNLGYETKNILLVKLPSSDAIRNYKKIKADFERIPEINQVSAASEIIGQSVTMNGYIPEGTTKPKLYKFCAIDYDYLKMLNIEILKGRNFSNQFSTDCSAYIINETMMKELNWGDPIGKTISRNGKHHVIGVVRDFHYEKVNNKIAPLIIGLAGEKETIYLYIKLTVDDYSFVLPKIERTWKEVFPNEPFSFSIYDSLQKDNYNELRRSTIISATFALFAILIACMGLYGLVVFTVNKRKKEIGIRKVFGADTFTIGRLVIFDFIKWIIIANIIAFPISYYYTNLFLQRFAYSINLNIIPFILSFIISIIIALTTIILQIMKLSNTQPAIALKYE